MQDVRTKYEIAREANFQLVREAMLFKLFSVGFSLPDQRVIEQIRAMADISTDWLWGDDYKECRTEIESALRETNEKALQSEYNKLFYDEIKLLARESHWKATFSKAHLLADINGFYQAFGLEMPSGYAEAQDHIAVELEYMSNLSLKRFYAQGSNLKEEEQICREAQSSFYEAHLDNWPLLLCRKVEEQADLRFYRSLAGYGEKFFRKMAENLEKAGAQNGG